MNNPKITLLQELHNIFATEEDMLLVQHRMNALLHSHRLSFRPGKDTGKSEILNDTAKTQRSFYDDLFADTHARDIAFFAVKCEQFIDFSPMLPEASAVHYNNLQAA